MPLKKSELYSSLWASCDELRGGMDASQYKDYVLVLLFVKYVSDKAASQKNYLLEVPRGGRFADMVALKGDKEIGDKINKIIARLAEANDLRGVIDVADFNDSDKLGKGKEMVDRLSNLVGIFEGLDFGANRAEGDDLLGDAYEYLMRHFATESGKSKGQFYTPAEVSRIMARVVGVGSAKSGGQTIYDPTCGSGSLLLKAHDEAKVATRLDLALYGQEMDNATAALARMNMILHDCPTAEIWKDNVLAAPHFKDQADRLKTFDYVVANPPFSFKSWTTGFDPANDLFHRFEFGVPPQKNGDLAFVLHILTSLKSTGKAAVNLPHGVLLNEAASKVRRAFCRRALRKVFAQRPAGGPAQRRWAFVRPQGPCPGGVGADSGPGPRLGGQVGGVGWRGTDRVRRRARGARLSRGAIGITGVMRQRHGGWAAGRGRTRHAASKPLNCSGVRQAPNRTIAFWQRGQAGPHRAGRVLAELVPLLVSLAAGAAVGAGGAECSCGSAGGCQVSCSAGVSQGFWPSKARTRLSRTLAAG